ncbi:hypothetical protein [Streptomyces sp. NBC_01257]|uniref:hypothetical protein n=1 Tax=Streptomyces sp. NBC_01257 TaxID=2903799 RepID=UPI002DD99F8B|nr:hypothetical protein [Streptomyces sp. NBC_01257]WRZ65414.1 hypothetical protein OG408_16675 [Streptomyces sp. NBC_01257]
MSCSTAAVDVPEPAGYRSESPIRRKSWFPLVDGTSEGSLSREGAPMRIRNSISTAVVVATATVGMIAATGSPAQADWVPPFRKCTSFDQNGFKGDVCVDRIGLGPQEFLGLGHIQEFPSNCARFRVDVVDPDGTAVRSVNNIPCATGAVGTARYLAELHVNGRAYARLVSFDSAGNTLLSVNSEIIVSPFDHH